MRQAAEHVGRERKMSEASRKVANDDCDPVCGPSLEQHRQQARRQQPLAGLDVLSAFMSASP